MVQRHVHFHQMPPPMPPPMPVMQAPPMVKEHLHIHQDAPPMPPQMPMQQPMMQSPPMATQHIHSHHYTPMSGTPQMAMPSNPNAVSGAGPLYYHRRRLGWEDEGEYGYQE